MIRPFRGLRLHAMKLFFGDRLTASDRIMIDEAYIRYQGRILRESRSLLSISADQLRQNIELEGEEHLQAALDLGHGAVLVCTHVGNWLLAPALLSTAGYRVSAIAFEIPIRSIEAHMQQIWTRYGITIAHPGRDSVRAAKKALDRNEILIIAYDASVRPADSVWMPFGDISIQADPGPSRLARLLKAPILRMHVRPLADARSVVIVRPDRTGESEDLMTAWLMELHDEVSAHPDLWWPWSFVRLSSRSTVVREQYHQPSGQESR